MRNGNRVVVYCSLKTPSAVSVSRGACRAPISSVPTYTSSGVRRCACTVRGVRVRCAHQAHTITRTHRLVDLIDQQIRSTAFTDQLTAVKTRL